MLALVLHLCVFFSLCEENVSPDVCVIRNTVGYVWPSLWRDRRLTLEILFGLVLWGEIAFVCEVKFLPHDATRKSPLWTFPLALLSLPQLQRTPIITKFQMGNLDNSRYILPKRSSNSVGESHDLGLPVS